MQRRTALSGIGMQEREAYIALNMVQGIGAVMVRNGVETLGSAAAIVSAGPDALAGIPGVGTVTSERFFRELSSVDWRGEMERAEKYNVRLITFADPEYPPQLKAIYDPPLVLYVSGSVDALSKSAVGMVGTRAPTAYGRETAGRFAFQLAQAGISVVSGLARGIDSESHAGALRGKGITVAVIGSALDKLYPAENRGLARKIIESGGAVVSEYPFGRSADKQTFPMRNRIVSGLSGAVLVVEAGLVSGTLITANQAADQGRPVLAVPGRIDSPASQGCHKLIRQGARLAESIDDVLDELQALPGTTGFRPERGKPESGAESVQECPVQLDDMEKLILAKLGDGEMDVEELIASTGLQARAVAPRLMGLEMKRVIRKLPGNLVAKK